MTLPEKVLDLARWAPSGDNTQPWRFEIRSNTEIVIHGYDTRTHCVYDLEGAASQFAHGALLETVALAATRFGYRADISTPNATPSGNITYRVSLVPAPGMLEDPLVPAITERVVQRRDVIRRIHRLHDVVDLLAMQQLVLLAGHVAAVDDSLLPALAIGVGLVEHVVDPLQRKAIVENPAWQQRARGIANHRQR